MMTRANTAILAHSSKALASGHGAGLVLVSREWTGPKSVVEMSMRKAAFRTDVQMIEATPALRRLESFLGEELSGQDV
jgi:hypothetical protein